MNTTLRPQPGLGRGRSETHKLGISLTLDPEIHEWLRLSAESEAVSVSYLVNRFCKLAKEALKDRTESPDKKNIRDNIKRKGFKDV